MTVINKIFFILIFLLPVITTAQTGSITEPRIDAATGLKTWSLIQSGLSLQLVQRLPDQTRGFYQGRGFTKQQANDIATACVFQTIVKNTSEKGVGEAISISLKTWRLKTINSSQNPLDKETLEQDIKLKEDWAKEWSAIKDKAKQVKQSARIAFKWSTFPSEQTFAPGGDYNWGMVSFGLAPGTQFDLQIIWQTSQQSHKESHKQWLKNIQCPEDR